MVRVGGFEPPRSRFQSEEADQTALHPHICLFVYWQGYKDLNPNLTALEAAMLSLHHTPTFYWSVLSDSNRCIEFCRLAPKPLG